MDKNILDDFTIKEDEKRTKNSSKQDENFYLFIGGIIFGIGYLMLIVNGYYHIKYIEFIQIGRRDLIARLGFLAYITGFLFYPTSIIAVGTINWILNKRKWKGMLRKLVFLILGLSIPGIVFYNSIEIPLLFGPKEKWILGIIVIGISIIFFKIQQIKDWIFKDQRAG